MNRMSGFASAMETNDLRMTSLLRTRNLTADGNTDNETSPKSSGIDISDSNERKTGSLEVLA
jgi:hypothetical protein